MTDSQKAAREIYDSMHVIDKDHVIFQPVIRSKDGNWATNNRDTVLERIREIIDKWLC